MHYFTFVLISLALFIGSFTYFISLNTSMKCRAIYCGMILVYVVLLITYFVSDYFTGEGINQATLYHLRYGLKGAGFSEYTNLISYAALILLISLLLFLYVFRKGTSTNIQHARLSKRYIAYGLLVIALIFNPASLDAYKIYESSQGKGHDNEDFFQYYESSTLQKGSQLARNFVFIYLEGFERTYFNDQLFPNLVPNLRELEATGISFTNIGQTTNAGWTIAGMVASQCGLPLFTPSSGNTMSGMDLFLPEADCLGDLLAAQGYDLAFYGGANLDFAGKGKFYASHHFKEINGLRKLQGQLTNPGYVSDWGLYDDSLLDLAFQRYLELSGRGERFGQFLLTLDTHHPIGHPSASCDGKVYQDGENSMLNAVHCTDELVSQFIARIRAADNSDNTVIVLVSDHLALRNSATGILDKGKRQNLFIILDPAQPEGRKIRKLGTTLDIGTTLLPFLGFYGDIGLGRDLLSDTVSLEQELGGLDPYLFSWQSVIEKFWAFPAIRRNLAVNVAAKSVDIDGRTFGFPTLIQLNEQLETEMRFEFNLSPGQRNLRDELSHFDSATPFIWIDDCARINFISRSREDGGVCLAIGRLDANPDRRRLNGKIVVVGQSLTMSANDIRETLFN